MSIEVGTKEDLDIILSLEREFFDDRTDIREAYELILELDGTVLIEYRNKTPKGMLATVEVDRILQNKERISALPGQSPFRESVIRGYLDTYYGYRLVHAFVSKSFSHDLVQHFLSLKKAVGFCYEDEEDALRLYERLGCRRVGLVQDMHSPEKRMYVLVYEKP